MTLREEFEDTVKTEKGGISVLFETSNQHYIEWLENQINKLRQDAVQGRFCSEEEIETLKEECYQDGFEDGQMRDY